MHTNKRYRRKDASRSLDFIQNQPLASEKQNIDSFSQNKSDKIDNGVCLRRDLMMISQLADDIYCNQNIKNVCIRSFDYSIPKLTSMSRISNDHKRMTLKASFGSFKTCHSLTWKDNIQLKQPKFLDLIFKRSRIRHFDIELYPMKFGMNNPHYYCKLIKKLPKSLRTIKVNFATYHPTLSKCLGALYSQLIKLPYLKKIEIAFDPVATPQELKLASINRALGRSHTLRQLIISPIMLASFLGNPSDELEFKNLIKLKHLTDIGIILDERVIPVLAAAVQSLCSFSDLLKISIEAVFPNTFGSLMVSLGSLVSLEEIHLQMVKVPIPLDELINLPLLKRLSLEYNSIMKWDQRQFERDIEVLTFIDRLEKLKLNLNGCRLASVKYLGVCLGRIATLRELEMILNQTISRDCVSEFFKALKSETINLERFSVSMVFSGKVIQEIEALSGMLKKLRKLNSFKLIELEDAKENKAAFRPEQLRKLCDGLSNSKEKIKRFHLEINRCEEFSDKKSVVILSEFLKTLRGIEEVYLNMGKRYFTDNEIKTILNWALEAETVKKIKIGGDFSKISQKMFQFIIDYMRKSFGRKEIQVFPDGYTKGHYPGLLETVSFKTIKRMF